MKAKHKDFDTHLLDSIDNALASLGESVRQSIYFHIENEFQVERKTIPENLEKFQAGLEKIFGTGAQFIEILIMKNLHAKIGQPLDVEKGRQLEFLDYVAAAEKSFLEK